MQCFGVAKYRSETESNKSLNIYNYSDAVQQVVVVRSYSYCPICGYLLSTVSKMLFTELHALAIRESHCWRGSVE